MQNYSDGFGAVNEKDFFHAHRRCCYFRFGLKWWFSEHHIR